MTAPYKPQYSAGQNVYVYRQEDTPMLIISARWNAGGMRWEYECKKADGKTWWYRDDLLYPFKLARMNVKHWIKGVA